VRVTTVESAVSAIRMDRIYRHQRHIYDFTRKYYLLGRDRLIDRLNPGATDSVLEIGCGTGRNLIRAAHRYPGTRFFGIDISAEMLGSASEAIARVGLSSRIVVAQADATAFDPGLLFGKAQFRRILISYSLSMIPGWRAVLHLAISMLAAGGEVHIVDFGDLKALPSWFGAALRKWLAQFAVTPCDGLELELTALARHANPTVTFERPYKGYAQYATIRRAK
jgi:S-adenosylmethionine-diacylgycerolhomoserine-N-methlytransferase